MRARTGGQKIKYAIVTTSPLASRTAVCRNGELPIVMISDFLELIMLATAL